MNMNEILATLLPSFLALKIFAHISKEKMRIIDLVIYYFIFVFLINLVVHVISVYIMGKDSARFNDEYTVTYLLIAAVAAIVIPFIASLVSKRITIKISSNDENK